MRNSERIKYYFTKKIETLNYLFPKISPYKHYGTLKVIYEPLICNKPLRKSVRFPTKIKEKNQERFDVL